MAVASSTTAVRGGARSGGPLRGAAAPLLVAAVIGLLVGRFVLLDGPAPTVVGTRAGASRSASSDVDRLTAELRSDPDFAPLLSQLAAAHLRVARESADPSAFALAADAAARAVRADPSAASLIVAGAVALARHEFATALANGERALALSPGSPDAAGVVVDALVELGRYPEAVVAAQQMVDLRPGLPSFARVSYVRELHGDPAGAVDAMRQAAVAGSGAAGDVAYVETLLGDLHLGRGALVPAERAYRRATSTGATAGLAEVGLARVAAARGDLTSAATSLRAAVNALPFPATAALYGDVLAAQGKASEAARQYALVRAIERLNAANGVQVDLELARFEADHARDAGADPSQAVELARAARVGRPTVFADDALGWALRQAGRPMEALPFALAATRLGTADALLWFHRAAAEADAGLTQDARSSLERARDLNPHLTLRDLPEAKAIASRVGVAW